MRTIRELWTGIIAGEYGAGAKNAMVGLFIVAILAFVFYIAISSLWPSAQETYNTSVLGVTETDAGTTTSQTFFSMGLWIIPVGLFVSLFVILITMARRGRSFRRK